jgi:cysteine synthase
MADFIANNELIISVDASGGNVTITLPAFATLRGYKVLVKR